MASAGGTAGVDLGPLLSIFTLRVPGLALRNLLREEYRDYLLTSVEAERFSEVLEVASAER